MIPKSPSELHKGVILPLLDDIKDKVWHGPRNAIIRQIERFKRMLYWGWHMRDSYDFDAQTLYHTIYLKLHRIHNCMKYDSHLMWNSDERNNGMRKLAEAKGLANSLGRESNRSFSHVSKVMKKYTDENTKKFMSSYSHTGSSKLIDSKLYRHMIHKALEKDELFYTSRKKRLFYLLDKYIDGWRD